MGKKLKDMRTLYGFTQDDIAGILDCSRINVIRMEKGQNGFTAKTIFVLCCAFQCSPKYFFPESTINKYTKKATAILKNKNKNKWATQLNFQGH